MSFTEYLFYMFIIFLMLNTYKRYFPVKSVPFIRNGSRRSNTLTLDIRDYNARKNNHSHEILNIPYGYLKRYNKEIPDLNIHLIASSKLELNLGLRFLRKKGYKIVSFEISPYDGKVDKYGI